jgi:hypothetical protein
MPLYTLTYWFLINIVKYMVLYVTREHRVEGECHFEFTEIPADTQRDNDG